MTITEAITETVPQVVRLPQAYGERIDIRPTIDSLRPAIQAAEEQIEAGVMPTELIETLWEAGFFHTQAPRELGGLELHPLDYWDFIFELSRINTSVAWVGTIQNGGMLLLSPERLRELTEEAGGRLILAGSHGRRGTARKVDGGYIINGDWAFASGSPWATIITAFCEVVDDSGAPVLDADTGTNVFIDCILWPHEIEFTTPWNGMGLRGTGSGQFRARDLFVEDSRAPGFEDLFDMVYADRALYASGGIDTTAAAILGAAQGVIDAFIETANLRRARVSFANRAQTLGQQQSHQIALATADALIRSTREWTNSLVIRRYEGAFDAHPDLAWEWTLEAQQLAAYAAIAAKQAATLIYNISGSDAVVKGRGIERAFRDTFTSGQHSLLLETTLSPVGQYLLTRDTPTGPVFEDVGGLLAPAPEGYSREGRN
ncbi:MAG TPA: acyl-CoA dehydrogenase family protein [Pseudolysinimonas sp.]|nr:acyl-CoA dehydrogenase family protein [Pseudolysinimonas sp.]